ncbi:MAG: hypothetical protein IT289_00520 [Oligoflexia bacterium]|nr:hypothetical protein [Oligoflexia bacterium]
MKLFIMFMASAVLASFANAASDFAQSTSKIGNVLPKAENLKVTGGVSTSVGTLTSAGGLDSSSRDNYFSVTPSLTVGSKDAYAASVSVPFIYDTSGVDTTTRIIGRPQVAGSVNFMDTPDTVAYFGLGFKMPLADSSRGSNELYRAAQIAPEVGLKRHLSGNLFAQASLNLSIDLNTQVDIEETNRLTYERTPVARAFAGVIRESDVMALGLGLQAIYGIGTTHVYFADPAGTTGRLDFNAVERLNLALTGRMDLGEGRAFTAGITKSLQQDIANSGSMMSAALASFDRPDEMANISANVGITQAF